MTERAVNQRVFAGATVYAATVVWAMYANPDFALWQVLGLPLLYAVALAGAVFGLIVFGG